MKNREEKVFVVFNTACIGDMLVTNTLVQNIKYYYPNSKVVFVCQKQYSDVARYQEGVDDVVVFDKKRDNSVKGIIKFVKHFPYKKPFASFVIYANDRNLLISRCLGSKHILSHHRCQLWHTKEKYSLPEHTHMMDKLGSLIVPLQGEHKKLPIKYNVPRISTPVIEYIKTVKNPVILCTTSNFYKKDMSIEDAKWLIEKLNKEDFTPILTGAGEIARGFSVALRKDGCFDFVDLVDSTSFPEFAAIMQICSRCITVDTGTLHFANALRVPVVGVFYAGCESIWAPDNKLYPAKTLVGSVSPLDIFNAFKELCGDINEVSTIL